METGKTLPINCNRYDCPVCGPIKVKRLKKAIHNAIKSWNGVRMMTLTLSSKAGDTPEEHYKILQECWRRFITELRRTKSLRRDQREFQYIRVPELHESGYMHMHMIISHFLKQQVLYPIWIHIIHEVTNDVFIGGGVTLTGNKSCSDGSNYITKYITKLIDEVVFIVRRYSKSDEVVLFSKKGKKSRWQFVLGCLPPIADQIYDEVMSFFTCNTFSITSQEKQLNYDFNSS
jgi:hypothetical protein